MKILLLHRDIGTGSVGRIVEDLYNGIKTAGHECKIAYGYINKTQITSADLISICNKKDIVTHALLSHITDKDGFYGKRNTQKLIEYIDRYKPDIIHIHGLYGYWIDIDTLYNYLKNTDITVINTLHSCWDFTGHCCYFTKANCERWKTHCDVCPEKREYPSSYLADRSYDNYEIKQKLMCSVRKMHYVAPSYWMRNCFKQSFLKKYDISVINNGIDIAAFKNTTKDISKYGIIENKKTILGVASNWEERKGFADFILLSRIISDDYQIVMVGLKREQIKKLPRNIIGIGRTESKSDLAAIYTAATVLFNPTYEDNYPTVNLEAIACGTPVITYNTGGSPEIIDELSAGAVIKEKDFKHLLQLTNRYSKKRISITDNAVNRLSNRRMINEYINLYQRLICNKEKNVQTSIV